MFVTPRDINHHSIMELAEGNNFSLYGVYLGNSVGAGTGNTTADANGYRSITFTTGTTANTYQGVVSTHGISGRNPSFQGIVGLDTASGVNAWVGLCTYCNPTTANNLDPADSIGLGFRHFSGTEATNWTCYASDGTTSSTADTGVAVDTVNMQRFDIIYISGLPQFFINSTRVCSGISTAHIPATTTTMGFESSWENTTTTSVTASVNSMYMGSN
jgi:hypothetical protein